jgi:hypothetical protein
MKRHLLVGITFVALLAGLALVQSTLQEAAQAQARGAVMAPRFEVDPTFPKPLPDHMYQGQTIGLWVDAQDHVWIVHRPDVLDAIEGASSQAPATGECCSVAPPVLEFAPGRDAAAALGREGWPRLSVARLEPRAEHRQQGQYLDRRQRRGRRARPQVHTGRQVRHAGRAARA